jgi:hypothetical protein
LANFSDVEAPEVRRRRRAQREKRFLVLAAFCRRSARVGFLAWSFSRVETKISFVPKSDSESFAASASAGATGSSPHTLAAR